MKKILMLLLTFTLMYGLFSCSDKNPKTPEELIIEKIHMVEASNQLKIDESVTLKVMDGEDEVRSQVSEKQFEYQQDPYYVYKYNKDHNDEILLIEDDTFTRVSLVEDNDDVPNKKIAVISRVGSTVPFHRMTQFQAILDATTLTQIDEDNYKLEAMLTDVYDIDEAYFHALFAMDSIVITNIETLTITIFVSLH